MKGRRLIQLSLFSLLVAAPFLSCTKVKKDRYIKQLKTSLPLYDSVTSSLIGKFSNRSGSNPVVIYPVGKTSLNDPNIVSDSSIRKFCDQNDISYIEITCMAKDSMVHECVVTYFLSDHNYQYVFDSKGSFDSEVFENTRVLVIPVNTKWVFKYEKPNF